MIPRSRISYSIEGRHSGRIDIRHVTELVDDLRRPGLRIRVRTNEIHPTAKRDKNGRERQTGGDISRIQALEGTPVPDQRATGSTQLALER